MSEQGRLVTADALPPCATEFGGLVYGFPMVHRFDEQEPEQGRFWVFCSSGCGMFADAPKIETPQYNTACALALAQVCMQVELEN